MATVIGAQPDLDRRLMAITKTRLWTKLTNKERSVIEADVLSGKDFGDLKKNTRTFFKKAENQIIKDQRKHAFDV